MFESYMAERLRRRWVRLRLYRFPGSVLTDSRHHMPGPLPSMKVPDQVR